MYILQSTYNFQLAIIHLKLDNKKTTINMKIEKINKQIKTIIKKR